MHKLFYSEKGEGRPVVFLHGFLETHAIWNEYAQQLSKDCKVITVDLPGFGKSILPGEKPFSISDIASHINRTLQSIGLERINVVGHSLGGYVALAMVEQQPDLFDSLCLFHSTALADSPERKEARTKTIEFVSRNGAQAFTSNFVTPLFADPNHPAIAKVTAMAIQTSSATVCGYLEAMRDRPDRTSVLKDFNGSVLLIAGEKDGIIPASTLEEQAKMARIGSFKLIQGIGHMGMFEAPSTCLEIIKAFLKLST